MQILFVIKVASQCASFSLPWKSRNIISCKLWYYFKSKHPTIPHPIIDILACSFVFCTDHVVQDYGDKTFYSSHGLGKVSFPRGTTICSQYKDFGCRWHDTTHQSFFFFFCGKVEQFILVLTLPNDQSRQ